MTDFTLNDRAKAALAACNVREAEFCRAYVKHASDSARTRLAADAAGYCADTPQSPQRDKALNAQGSKLLAKPHIVECIAALQECITKTVGIDIAWWLAENVDLYQTCKKMVPVCDMGGNELYKKPLDAKAAGAALDRIGKHIGAYEKAEKSELGDLLNDLLGSINGGRTYSNGGA